MLSEKIDLAYGDGFFRLDASRWPGAVMLLPDAPPAISAGKIKAELIDKLDNPCGAPPLGGLAHKAADACIVVSDRTRKYGLPLWLPALLDYLNDAGLPDERITALIANGIHGGHSPEQRDKLLGGNTAARVRAVDHDPDDERWLVNLGETPLGTPIEINRIFVEAELKIVTGSVTHHYHAGFTGGRKGIMPGIASRRAVVHNHSLVLAPDGGPHAGAAQGRLGGNPVYEDQAAAVSGFGDAFLINFITDGSGKPAAIFAGGLFRAHTRAAAAARAAYEVAVGKGFDLVIASGGGAPRDLNFYQSHKSLHNAFLATRPGGTVVLVAACGEGLGPAGFGDWFVIGNLDKIEERLRREHFIPGFTAYSTLKKTRAADVILVSKLGKETAALIGARHADTLDEALGMVRGKPETVAIMPQAGLTAPVEK